MAQSFTAHAATLKRALAFAAQATERRSTIPILSMVRIDTGVDSVMITGTDIDIECEATAEAIKVSDQFSLTINPNLLRGLLRWADGEVTITRAGDLITIEADDVVATVREVCPAADWPALQLGEALGLPVALTEAKLRKALQATAIAISTEETRYYLNGVWLKPRDGALRMVSTDGHRMVVYDTGEGWGLPGIILPRKTAQLLLRALPVKSNGAVSVTGFGPKAPEIPEGTDRFKAAMQKFGNGVPRLLFRGDGWAIRSKTIDGTFPDYSRVVPSPDDTISVTISAAQLRRFPPTTERCRAVKVDGEAGRMTYDDRDGVRVQMPLQGRGAEFGVNLGYLQAFAGLGGVIRLEGRGPGDPFRVLTDDPAFLGVQMPMRI